MKFIVTYWFVFFAFILTAQSTFVPDDIFESYLGLSNVVAQDSSTLGINSDGLDLFTDIRWSNFSGKPV
jgi:hypothetical protein